MDMKFKGSKMDILKGILLIVLIIITIINIYQNFSLKIVEMDYYNEKIPNDFRNMKILQISDFHNKKFLKGNYFIEKIEETAPDIIFITGDIINSRNPKYDIVEKTLEDLIKIAPIYYITGNHESRLRGFPKFIEKMKDIGVVVLEDESVEFTKNNSKINIIGVNDPSYYGRKNMIRSIDKLVKPEKFNILLSHRPEYFEEYANSNVDMVFSGHAHGGQIRIPFIGGIFAPNQGLFPKYIEGVHKKDDTTMIISRGIGSSSIPIRLFCQPEIILVTIL